MCGLPGSGKTTTAVELAASMAAVRLAPDEWLAALAFDGYDIEARGRIELLQWTLAQELLRLGQTVILEAGFWSRRERDEKRHAARALGVAVELRFLDASVDELWDRLAHRNASLADLGPATYAVTRED